jgi:hypothetical protein
MLVSKADIISRLQKDILLLQSFKQESLVQRRFGNRTYTTLFS